MNDFDHREETRPDIALVLFMRAKGQSGIQFEKKRLPIFGMEHEGDAIFVAENEQWLARDGSAYRVSVADQVATTVGSYGWVFIVVHRIDHEHLFAVLQFADRLRRRIPVEQIRLILPVSSEEHYNTSLEKMYDIATLICPSGMSWLWFGKVILEVQAKELVKRSDSVAKTLAEGVHHDNN